MAFFPPSLSANNKVFVSDEKFVADGGMARFAPFQQDCVIYWPWLSWNEIDVAVGPDQRCIPRCTLIGDSAVTLRSVAADGVGAIFRFGSDLGIQAFELIHNFDWYDRDNPIKKFAVCWFRLWQHIAAPVVVPIVGGADPASAAPIESGTIYVTTTPENSIPRYFGMAGVGGWVEVEMHPVNEGDDVRLNLYHTWPSSPVWFQTLYPGKQTVPMPGQGLGVSIWAQAAPDPTDSRFQIIALPSGAVLPARRKSP